MKILFEVTGLIPIYPEILSERPLGGTETAVVKIAEELSKLGLDVTVRTAHGETIAGSPFYLSYKDPVDFSSFSAVIIVQNLKAVPFMPNSTKIYLWTGDGAEQYSNYGLGDFRISKKLSKLILTTNFHKNSLCKASGFPLDKATVIGNGVSENFFASPDSDRCGMIYHSAPYRGLSILCGYFKELSAQFKSLKLDIYSDMELYRRTHKYVGPHSEILPSLEKTYSGFPGIQFHGTIPQKVLAEKLKQAAIFPYPCTVPEVFCMSMLEAMAAGVVPLVADTGGLAEVVGDTDLVVEGQPGTKAFDTEFVSRLKRILLDKDYLIEKRKNLTTRAREKFLWKTQAKAFYKLLTNEE